MLYSFFLLLSFFFLFHFPPKYALATLPENRRDRLVTLTQMCRTVSIRGRAFCFGNLLYDN